jgi:hypothetical protein
MTYIEQMIPASILKQMHELTSWVDIDGFWWGFNRVSAQKDPSTGNNICIIASKYLGQGCCEVIFVREGSGGVLEKKFIG